MQNSNKMRNMTASAKDKERKYNIKKGGNKL